jgi:hypothetical protein
MIGGDLMDRPAGRHTQNTSVAGLLEVRQSFQEICDMSDRNPIFVALKRGLEVDEGLDVPAIHVSKLRHS